MRSTVHPGRFTEDRTVPGPRTPLKLLALLADDARTPRRLESAAKPDA
ncbi:hypothetical protein [Actinomadura sp. NEAU-AAG7]|nr:hypothetical protein [Actinomadura sp. NEAU-AAG7]MBT2212180.1 hypothetical protein [Actinomadura sp. NEAU-AAG7]